MYLDGDDVGRGQRTEQWQCLWLWITGWWFGTMEFWMTFHILGIILPTDELIFFRGVGIPPTSEWFNFIIWVWQKHTPKKHRAQVIVEKRHVDIWTIYSQLSHIIPIERGIFAFTMIYIFGTCINKTYGNTGASELQKQHRINPCAEINIKSIGKTGKPIILDQCIIIISHIYIYIIYYIYT